VGGQQVLQTLQIWTDGQRWEQETCPYDKHEIVGDKIVENEERACAGWNVPKAVWIPRGGQVLVVWKQNAAEACVSLPPLQPVERPTDSALEAGWNGPEMDRGQIPACANL